MMTGLPAGDKKPEDLGRPPRSWMSRSRKTHIRVPSVEGQLGYPPDLLEQYKRGLQPPPKRVGSVFRAVMPAACFFWFLALVSAGTKPGPLPFAAWAAGLLFAVVGIVFDWRGWD